MGSYIGINVQLVGYSRSQSKMEFVDHGFPGYRSKQLCCCEIFQCAACLGRGLFGMRLGNREIRWVTACEKLRLSCYDISKERIEQAKINAGKANVSSQLNFEVGDVHTLELGVKKYDVVIIEGALHHFYSIVTVLDKVKMGLKEEGLLILNEYVGLPASTGRKRSSKRRIEY